MAGASRAPWLRGPAQALVCCSKAQASLTLNKARCVHLLQASTAQQGGKQESAFGVQSRQQLRPGICQVSGLDRPSQMRPTRHQPALCRLAAQCRPSGGGEAASQTRWVGEAASQTRWVGEAAPPTPPDSATRGSTRPLVLPGDTSEA